MATKNATRCAEPGCREEGIVGLGATPEWLCLAHFKARLTGIGANVRGIAGVLADARAPVSPGKEG